MQSEHEKARLTRQWLEIAARDLLAAERVLIGWPPLRDVAAFHWQQAAEKALKAFLTWNDLPFPESHDLLGLVQECESINEAFRQLEDSAILLTPYATELRYPDDIREPTPEATDLARESAKEIVQFVRASLPLELQI